MAGVLDLVVEQTSRPVGHGYVEAEVDRPNPFFRTGTRLRGHEFHYSRIVSGGASASACLRLGRGEGIGGGRDGLSVGRVWASYMHLHALGTPSWAAGFTALAHDHRSRAQPSPEGQRAGLPAGPAGGNSEADDDANGRTDHEFAPARA
jgi:cobyrinic acid a,c-diamide synthase